MGDAGMGSLGDRVQDLLPRPAADIVKFVREESVLLYASSLAFHALVSVVPLAVVSLWATALIIGDQELKRAAERFKEFAPENLGADTALTRVAHLGTAVGIPAIVAALWPASAYGGGLARAFEHLSPRRRRRLRVLRGRGLLLLVLLPLFIAGGIVGSYAGAEVVAGEGLVRVAGWAVALLGSFAGVFLASVVIYWLLPPERLERRPILEAAAITAAGVSVLSLLFTIYLNVGANFGEHYATSGLAGIVLFALWLLLANTCLLLGYRFAFVRS